MKIVTASGKKKILMTRGDWLRIGRQAGWTKKAGGDDYYTSTVDGAAGFERARGDYRDDAADDLRSEFPRERVVRHPDPRDPAYDGPDEEEGSILREEEAQEKAEKEAEELAAEEGGKLFESVKAALPAEWAAAVARIKSEGDKDIHGVVDDFTQASVELKVVESCSEPVWNAMQDAAFFGLLAAAGLK